jgi:hypothetical protein
MRQGIGQDFAIPNVGTSLPTGTQGLAMSTVTDGRKPKMYRLTITVSAGAPVVNLVGSDTEAGTVWGKLGDSNALNGGAALGVETRFFFVENLGAMKRIGVLLSAGTATATLTPIGENGD